MESKPDTQYQTPTRLDLLMGRREKGSLAKVCPVGHLLLFPGDSYYLVKLWMFGSQTFYMVKSHSKPNFFTLFGRKVVSPDGRFKFDHPIGNAAIYPDFPNYIELRFKLMNCSLFASIVPSQGRHLELVLED